MIRFFLILAAASFGCLLAQYFIPPLPFIADFPFLEGCRIFLMPLVLFYGALALPYGGMLFLALLCGFMWDASTVQVLNMNPPVVELAMGWSSILYCILGSVMSGFRPLFIKGRWEIHCLVSGICTSLILLAEFLMLSIRRAAIFEAPIIFPVEIWWRIGGAGLAATILAPAMFFLLNSMASFVGYNPRLEAQNEQEEER